ncbi:MAG: M23 family metallopeptidase [Clostridia bacterium]|nr:M23 family metallopeptidase [Clostridia bacterium]
MNYSQKTTAKGYKHLAGGIAKALFVIAIAFLFCSNTGYMGQIEDSAVSTVAQPYTLPALPDDITEDEGAEQNGFVNPTEGVLTSAFGMRGGRNHNGIDIGAERGVDIYAAQDGKVVLAEVVSGYGNYIIIEHKDGIETAYAHCDSILVSAGEEVKAGQLIAYVGSTGNSTGPHLHFEVKAGGRFCDPLDYVVY